MPGPRIGREVRFGTRSGGVPDGGWGDLASSAKSCSAEVIAKRISCLDETRGRFRPPPLVGLLPRSRGETQEQALACSFPAFSLTR